MGEEPGLQDLDLVLDGPVSTLASTLVLCASCGRGRGRGHVAHGPVDRQLSRLEVVVQMPFFSRHGDLRAGEPGYSYLSPTHKPQPLAAV